MHGPKTLLCVSKFNCIICSLQKINQSLKHQLEIAHDELEVLYYIDEFIVSCYSTRFYCRDNVRAEHHERSRGAQTAYLMTMT
jgi:hypothetical protein